MRLGQWYSRKNSISGYKLIPLTGVIIICVKADAIERIARSGLQNTP
jgi:hypothetical protein